MRTVLGNAPAGTVELIKEQSQVRIHLGSSKHNQAVPHTDVVSCNPRSGAAATSKDDCEYVKLDEVKLPDGTKMKFYARKENAPAFDELMNEIYELASEALVRKLSK
jgi:hypothetical protein